ncbi:MAG: hypothetical protein HZC22_13270 [Rhodocyclales bacterium]|nr:hypothetical protein [Rhodocyclales bacterium]
MKQPTARTSMNDPRRGVTYHVVAYRSLTRAEMIDCISAYLSQKNHPKPKRGQAVTIITSIGHDA